MPLEKERVLTVVSKSTHERLKKASEVLPFSMRVMADAAINEYLEKQFMMAQKSPTWLTPK